MHNYHIQQVVMTPSELYRPWKAGDYEFRPYRDNNQYHADRNWIVIRTIEANDWWSAYSLFSRELSPILDAASFVSQCSVATLFHSFSVYRDHDEKCALVFVSRLSGPVGVHLDTHEWPDVLKLYMSSMLPALTFLRLSNNIPQGVGRLFLLTACAEALAGFEHVSRTCPHCQKELPRYDRTSREQLKSILGSEVYDALYEKNHGALRHKLFHGVMPEPEEIEVVRPLYDRLLAHVAGACGLTGVRKITKAPRVDGSTFEHSAVFIRSAGPVRLNEVEGPLWDYLERRSAGKLQVVMPGPEDY